MKKIMKRFKLKKSFKNYLINLKNLIIILKNYLI